MPFLSRTNPFTSNSSLPGLGVADSQPGSNGSQPQSSFQTSADAPTITLSSPALNTTTQSGLPLQPGLDVADLEEPPPYTPNPSPTSGETTVEIGPNRPFQTVQPSANPARNGLSQVPNQVTHSRSPSSPLPALSRPTQAASMFQQLTNIVDDLSSSASYHLNPNNRGAANVRPTWQSNSWSYPTQNTRPAPASLSNPAPRNPHLAPPPRHPLSPSAYLQPPSLSTSTHSLPSMANHSSDFARDFYAAGTGSGEDLVTENTFAPPTGPPPSQRQASTTHVAIPNDGRPTSQPQPGHPLLKDGNLLVYPKGFECRKCHNMGYKGGRPQKPCKHCWKNYAKPFTGPLAYSFPANAGSSSLASNFQKPLPSSFSSPIPAASSSSPPGPPLLARSAPSGYYYGGFQNPPTGFIPPIPPPAGNSVTYMAGDPRIGGTLCLRCGGKGNVEMIFFQETCPVCSGVGRVFSSFRG